MGKQICGIILEGQSCSGKTSLFNALKRYHMSLREGERNVIYLSENYSQSLNLVNGKFEYRSAEENMRVLFDRISMLEQLNGYANAMGEHSRRARGLFFVFERFHLNYAFSHDVISLDLYRQLEERISMLNTIVVLCTIGEKTIEQRLRHRATYTKELITPDKIDEYSKMQEKFIRLANNSAVPTFILNTDDMDWDNYARMICNKLFAESVNLRK